MEQICFFNTAKAWGGGEKWHYETSKYLHLKGYTVFVFAHKESALLQKLQNAKIPCKGISISNLSFLNPFLYNKFTKLFKQLNFKTIVLNLSRDLKIAGPAAKKAGVKRIIYRRGSAIPIKNSFLNRYYFKNILTDVLANSNATKQTVLENNEKLFPKEKITVIPNGISTDQKIPSTTIQDVFTLANLGRLEYQKNQKFLIHLAAELKQRNLNFKIHIGGEGSLRSELENSILELGVTKEIILAGFIDKPLEFISNCDVFLLPSFWEGFGYVLAEASLCKKPIIAFNCSSNPEVVLHNKTGYLTKKNDIIEFADYIEELAANPKKKDQLGIQGHEYIKTNFDKAKQLKKIENYLVIE